VIYFVGGAPRAGTSIVNQQIASELGVGWVSTDWLVELLRVKDENGVSVAWNAAPEAILSSAEWFFPYLERFVWRVSTQAEHYLIEGVGFLPAQVAQLSEHYPIRSAFLGCS
jgi:2-phosphoglycerate kinase